MRINKNRETGSYWRLLGGWWLRLYLAASNFTWERESERYYWVWVELAHSTEKGSQRRDIWRQRDEETRVCITTFHKLKMNDHMGLTKVALEEADRGGLVWSTMAVSKPHTRKGSCPRRMRPHFIIQCNKQEETPAERLLGLRVRTCFYTLDPFLTEMHWLVQLLWETAGNRSSSVTCLFSLSRPLCAGKAEVNNRRQLLSLTEGAVWESCFKLFRSPNWRRSRKISQSHNETNSTRTPGINVWLSRPLLIARISAS